MVVSLLTGAKDGVVIGKTVLVVGFTSDIVEITVISSFSVVEDVSKKTNSNVNVVVSLYFLSSSYLY